MEPNIGSSRINGVKNGEMMDTLNSLEEKKGKIIKFNMKKNKIDFFFINY